MSPIYLILGVAAVLALLRVVMALRKGRNSTDDDWDARLVQNLRSAGGNSFTPYEVDFFFNLPDEPACDKLRKALEPEGFSVDMRIMGGEAASGYSLHARKHLRVSIGEMQEFSKRFRALAAELGGHYDGWMTDPSRQ